MNDEHTIDQEQWKIDNEEDREFRNAITTICDLAKDKPDVYRHARRTFCKQFIVATLSCPLIPVDCITRSAHHSFLDLNPSTRLRNGMSIAGQAQCAADR